MNRRINSRERKFPIKDIIIDSNHKFVSDILFNNKNIYISIIYWMFTFLYIAASYVLMVKQRQISTNIILAPFGGYLFLILGLYIVYMVFIIIPIELLNYGVKEIKENVNKIFRCVPLPISFSLQCDKNEINEYVDIDKIPSNATLSFWIYKLKMRTTRLALISPVVYLMYEMIKCFALHLPKIDGIIKKIIVVPTDVQNIAIIAFSTLVVTNEIVLMNECKAKIEFLRDLNLKNITTIRT